MAAFIDGHEVALPVAVTEAARMLATACMPVIAGLGTDIAGARAMLALAARVGAAVDHMHAGALLRDLDVMREAGMMVTTPSEARLRADAFLLVGRSLAGASEMQARLLQNLSLRRGKTDEAIQETGRKTRLLRSARYDEARDTSRPFDRRIIWLCPPRKTGVHAGLIETTTIGRDAAELPTLLALLRARARGHPVTVVGRALKSLDAAVATLKAARFGVAIWSAADLDALSIEMLCALVDDLNAETRFSGLPLPPPDNGRGVLETCGWTTGLPMRTGFGRGWPEHDPWRFDAARLVESGECDCVLWISAMSGAIPGWRREVPTIVLTAPGTAFHCGQHVRIEVGAPGLDHDAVAFNPLSGALMPAAATLPSDRLSVAAVIADMLSALPGREAAPC